MKNKKALIIANGKPPKKSDVIYLIKRGYDFIIAADGGANSLKKIGIAPNVIIGDFDSVTEETLDFFRAKSEIKRLKRQSDTDVEKAIKFAISKKFTDAILLGASGDRLDHTLCNIGNLLKYGDKIKLGMLHEKTFARVYKGKITLRTVPNETVSFYAFSRKTRITTKGLKYRLENEPLPFGERSSTSNVARAEEIEINSKSGKIIVIREFEIIKRNDFLYDV